MGWFGKKKEPEVKIVSNNEVVDVNKAYADFEKQVSVFSALKSKIVQLQQQVNDNNVKLAEKDREIKRLNDELNKVVNFLEEIKKYK